MTRAPIVLAFLLLAAACGRAETPPDESASIPEGLTTEQQAAYEQCLEDNMAVAVAWEMIQQQCLEEVTAEPALLDPVPPTPSSG